jgi:hypothetical protein
VKKIQSPRFFFCSKKFGQKKSGWGGFLKKSQVFFPISIIIEIGKKLTDKRGKIQCDETSFFSIHSYLIHIHSKNMNELYKCHACDKKIERIFLCGGCMEVWYCNLACQSADWKEHSSECIKNFVKHSAEERARELHAMVEEINEHILGTWNAFISSEAFVGQNGHTSEFEKFKENYKEVTEYIGNSFIPTIEIAGKDVVTAITTLSRAGVIAFCDPNSFLSSMWKTIFEQKRSPNTYESIGKILAVIGNSFVNSLEMLVKSIRYPIPAIINKSINVITTIGRSVATAVKTLSDKVIRMLEFIVSGRMKIDLPSWSMKKIENVKTTTTTVAETEKLQQSSSTTTQKEAEGVVWTILESTAKSISNALKLMMEAFKDIVSNAITKTVKYIFTVVTKVTKGTEQWAASVRWGITRLAHFALSLCVQFPGSVEMDSEIKKLYVSARDAILDTIKDLEFLWNVHIKPAIEGLLPKTEGNSAWKESFTNMMTGLSVISGAVSSLSSMCMSIFGQLLQSLADEFGDALTIPLCSICYGKEPIDLLRLSSEKQDITTEDVFDPDMLEELAVELRYQRTDGRMKMVKDITKKETELLEILSKYQTSKNDITKSCYEAGKRLGMSRLFKTLWSASGIGFQWSIGWEDTAKIRTSARKITKQIMGPGAIKKMKLHASLGARLSSMLCEVMEELRAAGEHKSIVDEVLKIVAHGVFVNDQRYVGGCMDSLTSEMWLTGKKKGKNVLDAEAERLWTLVKLAKTVGDRSLAAIKTGDWSGIPWIEKWMVRKNQQVTTSNSTSTPTISKSFGTALAVRFCALGCGGVEATFMSLIAFEMPNTIDHHNMMTLRSADAAVRILQQNMTAGTRVELSKAIVGLWQVVTENQFLITEKKEEMKGGGGLTIADIIKKIKDAAVTALEEPGQMNKPKREHIFGQEREYEERIRRSLKRAYRLTKESNQTLAVSASDWVIGLLSKPGIDIEWTRLAKKAEPPPGFENSDRWISLHAMLCWLWGEAGCNFIVNSMKAGEYALRSSVQSQIYGGITALLSLSIGPAATPIMKIVSLLFMAINLYSACNEVNIIATSSVTSSIYEAFGVEDVYENVRGSMEEIANSSRRIRETYKSPALSWSSNVLCTILPTHVDAFASRMLFRALKKI